MFSQAIIFFLAAACFLAPAEAQFNQKWTWHASTNGNPTPKWRPLNSGAWLDVVGFGTKAVWLDYNCYWMPAICQNARNYFNTPAGQDRNWPTAFTYDFEKTRSDEETKGRRSYACPSSKTSSDKSKQWKFFHSCPEKDQPIPMRSKLTARQGEWHHTELEYPLVPGEQIIKSYQPADGSAAVPSGLRYSCDEFPPASWVEGGSGINGGGDVALTRCAPIGECMGVAGEQNWQGLIHNQLRMSILKINRLPKEKTDTAKDVRASKAGLFFLRLSNGGFSEPAARVLINDGGVERVDKKITPRPGRRRRSAANMDFGIFEFMNWANNVTVEELLSGNDTQSTEFQLLNGTMQTVVRKRVQQLAVNVQ
ncbi:hypothetical protein CORC01_01745 [Colletotrichum orchidophilum]|uniref:Uncharacterized protein n=1 Tax=Colletotrichum orchidophilum TaxID=1209926 RepID=A0A1G4BNT9_9PEZI|nr:uncharacterized protein CORC01_01745 [Colletotrichum orchidophilum]OHF02987.1 hypothetical protein CORC01_01745 [Colletotrichum orchidophilum]